MLKEREGLNTCVCRWALVHRCHPLRAAASSLTGHPGPCVSCQRGPTSSQPPSTGEAACLMVYSGVPRPSQPISTRHAHAQVGVHGHPVHRGAQGAPTVPRVDGDESQARRPHQPWPAHTVLVGQHRGLLDALCTAGSTAAGRQPRLCSAVGAASCSKSCAASARPRVEDYSL